MNRRVTVQVGERTIVFVVGAREKNQVGVWARVDGEDVGFDGWSDFRTIEPNAGQRANYEKAVAFLGDSFTAAMQAWVDAVRAARSST